jgi:hypothetical protein
MCLDPRPERLSRPSNRPRRRVVTRRSEAVRAFAPATRLQDASTSSTAFRLLDTLAGDDDLISRGWVLLTPTTA